jgi:hypothetical protein
MKYPLSKKKDAGPMEYTYRGYDVLAHRTYGGGFQGVELYCTSSMYHCSELKCGSSDVKRFKKMMDRRIDKLQNEEVA